MIEVLYKTDWLSLRKIVDPEKCVDGYVYSHEDRCSGRIIAVLPFKFDHSIVYYLLRREVTPCWGMRQYVSSITGGYEGGDPRDTVVLEMKEEAGFEIDKKDLISLDTSFASKSSDTIYYLYSIDLTDKQAGKPSSDGSKLEQMANCFWATEEEMMIENIKDPQVYVLLTRLKHLKN